MVCTYFAVPTKRTNLELKTWPKQLLVSLPLHVQLPDSGKHKIYEGQSVVDYLIVILSSRDEMNEANVVK
jgi:hypothetical protein